ncbi:MAG: oxidoreductase [Gemmatimonadetes bacterium]|nr:oxidoreductase [Gemmatimonadota bacterium]
MKASTLLFLLPLLLSSSTVHAQRAAPMRIGVVGLTHSHVHGLLGRKPIGDIVIVGIVEKNKELARRYTKRYGLSMDLVFDTMDEMLDKTKPTAVTAFGSTYEHLAVVQAAAPRGVHVMVEKPLAVSLDHARKMKALADQHHIVLMVNYETTWYATLYQAVELVQSDKIGPLRKVVVHDGHSGPKKIHVDPEFMEWLGDPVQNGAGALMDFGCYGANLMTYLMQGTRPTSVTAVTQHLQPAEYPKVDDEATIVVTYPETQAVIQASWNWPISRKDLELYGTRGYVMTDNRAKIRTRFSEAEQESARSLPEREYPNNDPFAYLKALVEGTAKPGAYDPSSLANNMIVMEILEAAKQSAQQGRTITLPTEHSALPRRPRITGISHAAFYVSDMAKARQFYEGFLGFASPFSIPRPSGGDLVWIKVNDRQTVELFPGSEVAPDARRLFHIAVEVDDAEAMRVYLRSRGVTVPEATATGKIGNKNYFVKDPNGNVVEIVQYMPDGWTAREKGRHLPDTRISTRMTHVGVMIGQLDSAMTFYRDILGFREFWRGSSDEKTLSWVNMRVPDGDDYVEFMLYDKAPPVDRARSMEHICLEVPSVEGAAATLAQRAPPAGNKAPSAPRVGVNGKRQINYFDPDGTRVELMEPTTIDGKPRPSSPTPPPVGERRE